MKSTITEMKNVIRAYDNKVRSRILELLNDGEMTVNDLTKALDVEQSVTSQHLRVLREEKLVKYRRQNKFSFYYRNEPMLQKLRDCCDEFYQTKVIL